MQNKCRTFNKTGIENVWPRAVFIYLQLSASRWICIRESIGRQLMWPPIWGWHNCWNMMGIGCKCSMQNMPIQRVPAHLSFDLGGGLLRLVVRSHLTRCRDCRCLAGDRLSMHTYTCQVNWCSQRLRLLKMPLCVAEYECHWNVCWHWLLLPKSTENSIMNPICWKLL